MDWKRAALDVGLMAWSFIIGYVHRSLSTPQCPELQKIRFRYDHSERITEQVVRCDLKESHRGPCRYKDKHMVGPAHWVPKKS